jgi:hypothetical protein
VALAWRLAVDLWRMATGRVQAEELGLLSKEIADEPEKESLPIRKSLTLRLQESFGTAHPRHRR